MTRISAIVGDGVVLIVPARSGAGPPEHRRIGNHRLNRWAFDYCYMLGRLYRWKNLRSGVIRRYDYDDQRQGRGAGVSKPRRSLVRVHNLEPTRKPRSARAGDHG